jgi:transposase
MDRLNFAIHNLNTNWKLVIFSDEKLFSLNKTSNRVWVEDGSPPPTRELTQNNYSVMVWGGIWYQGRTTLCIPTGNVNGPRYCEILEEHLLPSYPNQNFKLLQDNATSHTSKYTKTWCRDWGISLFPDYPPWSPDCNPIELLWARMVKLVNGMSPSSPEELHNAIEHAWDEIPQTFIQSLVNRLPTVLQEIIKVDGDHY